jgi:hypothetical protein
MKPVHVTVDVSPISIEAGAAVQLGGSTGYSVAATAAPLAPPRSSRPARAITVRLFFMTPPISARSFGGGT